MYQAIKRSTFSLLFGNPPEYQAGQCVIITHARVLLLTSRETVTDGWTPVCILITQTTQSHTNTFYTAKDTHTDTRPHTPKPS